MSLQQLSLNAGGVLKQRSAQGALLIVQGCLYLLGTALLVRLVQATGVLRIVEGGLDAQGAPQGLGATVSLLGVPVTYAALITGAVLGFFVVRPAANAVVNSVLAEILSTSTEEKSFREMKRAIRATFEILAQLIIGAVVAFAVLAALAARGVLQANGLLWLFSMAGALALGALTFLFVGALFHEDVRHVRGTRLRPYWQIQRWSLWRTWRDPNRFLWAGTWFPGYTGLLGLAAVGAPGTGKTVTIRLFLQSVVHRVFTRPDNRMLIMDSKQDMMPLLAGMGIDTRVEARAVRMLYPYDRRSWVWDLAAEFGQGDEQLQELLTLLVPESKDGKDAFWQNGSRNILGGIITAWGLTGKTRWTLRDLLSAMLTLDRMQRILKSTPSTAYILDKVLAEAAETTTKNMELSLWANVQAYVPIAKAWHRVLQEDKERRLSISQWMRDSQGSIIVLQPGALGTAVDILNQAVIRRMNQVVQFSLPNSSTRRTWLVLDELRVIGKLEVTNLVEYGRSKGIGVVMGFQDKSGMDEVYNRPVADEMVGACQTKVFFHLAANSTAQWAANEMNAGEVERFDKGKRSREERQAITAAEFMSSEAFPIPDPERSDPITFAVKSTACGNYRAQTSYNWTNRRLMRPDTTVNGQEPLPPGLTPWPDWTPEEERYFCGSVAAAPEVDPDVPAEVQRERPYEGGPRRLSDVPRRAASPNRPRYAAPRRAENPERRQFFIDTLSTKYAERIKERELKGRARAPRQASEPER